MSHSSVSPTSMPRAHRILARTLVTIFAISALLTTSAWCAPGSKVLYSFAGTPDGANPYSSLIFDSAGNLYGTTEKGGTNGGGTVFELSQSNGVWTETTLHNFTGNFTDGFQPESSLVFDQAGNLYGTTYDGGAYSGGTVYELSPAGNGLWNETVLHNFNPSNGDGFNPNSGVFVM